MMEHTNPSTWYGTTIVSVRKDGKVVIAGDGQVTLGATVIKHTARKVRPLGRGDVLATTPILGLSVDDDDGVIGKVAPKLAGGIALRCGQVIPNGDNAGAGDAVVADGGGVAGHVRVSLLCLAWADPLASCNPYTRPKFRTKEEKRHGVKNIFDP